MSLLAIAFSELKRPDRTDLIGLTVVVLIVVVVVVLVVVVVVLEVVVLGRVHLGSFSPLIKLKKNKSN